jgi:hypothetical protein
MAWIILPRPYSDTASQCPLVVVTGNKAKIADAMKFDQRGNSEKRSFGHGFQQTIFTAKPTG